LNFIRKETNDNSINLYYQLNELEKIKIYFSNKILLEKIFPSSTSSKRPRDLLSIQLKKILIFYLITKLFIPRKNLLFS
jgi:hypothetical protein